MVDNKDIYVQDVTQPNAPVTTLQQILDDDGFVDPVTITDRVANLEDIVATLGLQVANVGSQVSAINDQVIETAAMKVDNV